MHLRPHTRVTLLSALAAATLSAARAHADAWDSYAENPQHTALSPVASQPLNAIHWQTPVDTNLTEIGGEILIHYGSPLITPNNTVIVPVKGANDSFILNAYNGATGSFMWTQSTSYQLPPKAGGDYSWIPPFAPALANGNTLYYPGPGGTIYKQTNLDTSSPTPPPTSQLTFYSGIAPYQPSFDSNISVSTPITSDAQGDIYFGYQSNSAASPGNITSGIARISSTGQSTFFQASSLLDSSNNPANMTQVVTNSAPALSNDGNTVYVAMSNGNFGTGRLVALNASNLTQINSAVLMDPKTNSPAKLPNDGTASPTVGPDGDVYMGVFDNNNTSRGWLDHFTSTLATTRPGSTVALPTGGFGWDDTASIVPASMVPSYQGSSTYLIMTKYNNYADGFSGGNGLNMIAILDPNDTQVDTRDGNPALDGATIMKVVLSILGPTHDADFPSLPNAVREWCINSAVVDQATDSILVNNEDGTLYRWNLSSNTLTQSINITNGIGEAYTPTLIGPDGTVYAINNATLFAIGAVPEPTTLTALALAATTLLLNRRKPRPNSRL